jgi:hypothetical protein
MSPQQRYALLLWAFKGLGDLHALSSRDRLTLSHDINDVVLSVVLPEGLPPHKALPGLLAHLTSTTWEAIWDHQVHEPGLAWPYDWSCVFWTETPHLWKSVSPLTQSRVVAGALWPQRGRPSEDRTLSMPFEGAPAWDRALMALLHDPLSWARLASHQAIPEGVIERARANPAQWGPFLDAAGGVWRALWERLLLETCLETAP